MTTRPCNQLLVLVFAVCCTTLLSGQAMPKIAERYLHIMYPQYTNGPVTTIATESGHPVRTWYVWVNRPPKDVPLPVDVLFVGSSTPCELGSLQYFPHGACLPRFMPENNGQSGLLFLAVFQIPDWDRRRLYNFYGSSVETEARNAVFKEKLRQHSEWTDEDRLAQLKMLDAKFGPNERAALLSSATMTRMRHLLGPYSVKSAKFLWYDEYISLSAAHSTQRSEAVYWQIEAVLSRKPYRHYVFIIEPMAGELTEMYPVRPTPVPKPTVSGQK